MTTAADILMHSLRNAHAMEKQAIVMAEYLRREQAGEPAKR
jgi:ferritin-like metal-binding protein YciE